GAFSYETPDDFVLAAREPQRLQHGVHRVGDVAARVHQRAVQVKDDRFQGHVRSRTAGGRLTPGSPARSEGRTGRIPPWRTKHIRKILSLAAMVAVAACGGAAQDDFANATPSFDSVALDISASDTVPENFEAPASTQQALAADVQVANDDPC